MWSLALAWSVQSHLSLSLLQQSLNEVCSSLARPSPPPLATTSCDARGEEGFTQFASNDTILISRGNTFEFWAQSRMNDTNDFKSFKDYREAGTDDILSLS